MSHPGDRPLPPPQVRFPIPSGPSEAEAAGRNAAATARPWWKRGWAIALVGAVVVGVAAFGLAARGGDDEPSAVTTDAASASPELSGAVFDDPQGAYTMTIGREWLRLPGVFVEEVETWSFGPVGAEFASNVNVLTQAAPGMDLESYLDFSVANFGGLELIERDTVRGARGNDLGVLEYAGVVPGADRPLRFLALIDVRDERAIVATLTATEDEFAAKRALAEPYLLTLQSR